MCNMIKDFLKMFFTTNGKNYFLIQCCLQFFICIKGPFPYTRHSFSITLHITFQYNILLYHPIFQTEYFYMYFSKPFLYRNRYCISKCKYTYRCKVSVFQFFYMFHEFFLEKVGIWWRF